MSNLDNRVNDWLRKKAEYDSNKQKSKILYLLQKGIEILINLATKYIEKRIKK